RESHSLDADLCWPRRDARHRTERAGLNGGMLERHLGDRGRLLGVDRNWYAHHQRDIDGDEEYETAQGSSLLFRQGRKPPRPSDVVTAVLTALTVGDALHLSRRGVKGGCAVVLGSPANGTGA